MTPLPESGDIGMNVHGFASLNATDDALRNQYLQLLRNSNVGWARVDVEWRSIQPDNAASWNWGDVDSTMARAYCAGINVLGTLDYTPTWASSNPNAAEPKNYNPADSTDWMNFVSAAVSRYPWVKYWSIWNEPNDSGFYSGSASDYAKLVGWASPSIHNNADGQGPRFLVGGEFGWISNAFAWVDTLIAAQGPNVDVLSVHMYGQPPDSVITQIVNRPSVASSAKVVWLTETNLTGCHDNANLQTNPMCVNAFGSTSGPTTDRDYIDDGIQASYVDSVVAAMRRGGTRWRKTFFYDATESIEMGATAQDYGIFGGFTTHALYGKQAYYHLAAAAGVSPYVSVSGPTMLSRGASGTFSASVTGGRASSSYYYEWRFKCTPRSTPTGECNGVEIEWDEGWGLTSVVVDAPLVDGTALITAYIRDTELDSPVTPAYADKASKKFSVSRY
jgi:hypothetical protein